MTSTKAQNIVTLCCLDSSISLTFQGFCFHHIYFKTLNYANNNASVGQNRLATFESLVDGTLMNCRFCLRRLI